jgi:eukaryotic-like serine/threonine-protein kinase
VNDPSPLDVTELLSRRSSSAGRFSGALHCYRDGLPIVAPKETVAYGSTKLVGISRIAVSAATLGVLAIITGLVIALWQAGKATAERDVAQRSNAFLQDMLGAAALDAKGTDIKVADLLNEASPRAKTELVLQPDVMADVLMTLGRTRISLGQSDKAESDLRAALEASLKANGELHPTTATILGWLGLALANLNRTAEGEQISRKAVELQRKLHPRGHEDLGMALYALGVNLINKNKPIAAQPFLKEASDLIKRHLGETHGYYMTSLIKLASAHEQEGEAGVAESLYRQAIDVGGRVESRYRMFLGQAQVSLGILLTNNAAYPEAEAMLRQSEVTYSQIDGIDSDYNVGGVKASLGRLYFLKGDYSKAETEARKALVLLRNNFGSERSLATSAAVTLGLALTRAGSAAEGEPYLREALETRRKNLPLDNFVIPYTESALGECLTAQKRYTEAEPLVTDGYSGLIWKLGEKDTRTMEARQRMAKLYDDWDRPDQALLFR